MSAIEKLRTLISDEERRHRTVMHDLELRLRKELRDDKSREAHMKWLSAVDGWTEEERAIAWLERCAGIGRKTARAAVGTSAAALWDRAIPRHQGERIVVNGRSNRRLETVLERAWCHDMRTAPWNHPRAKWWWPL